jgi:hypothetical protein
MTRKENGKTLRYRMPECGKRGRSNAFLMLVSLETFKEISESDKSRCCVNCLASLK